MGFMALNAYELVTLGGFMFFWGWVFLGSTMWVILEKQDEHTPQPGTAASQLYAAYKEMWLVLQLPAVREMALVLLTVKAPLAAFDALGPLELQACAAALLCAPLHSSALLCTHCAHCALAPSRPRALTMRVLPCRKAACPRRRSPRSR